VVWGWATRASRSDHLLDESYVAPPSSGARAQMVRGEIQVGWLTTSLSRPPTGSQHLGPWRRREDDSAEHAAPRRDERVVHRGEGRARREDVVDDDDGRRRVASAGDQRPREVPAACVAAETRLVPHPRPTSQRALVAPGVDTPG